MWRWWTSISNTNNTTNTTNTNSYNTDNSTVNNIDNSTTNNINNNIQYNTIALTKDNFNVDKITINDILYGTNSISRMLLNGVTLPNGKKNYVCTDTSRLTYNRLTEDGEWVIDPEGYYMRTKIYSKLTKKINDVYDKHNDNNLFYSEEEQIETLMNKTEITRPTDDFYKKALRGLAPKVYVQRNKLKDYLLN